MKKIFTLFLSFLFVFVGCKQAPDKFTITYHTEHGETPSSLIVEDGYLLTADDLPTLSEDGYTFNGWDKAVGDEITEDTDITASWTKNPPTPVPNPKINITYVSDHGTLPKKDPVDKGYKLTADDLPTLSEDGYAFKGWDKTVGDELTADTTITALWVKTWKITYTSNKTELKDKLPAAKTVDEGYKLTADDLTALTADDYNFKGWDKSAGLEIKADVTITGSWAKLYKITYSVSSGTAPEPKIVEDGYVLVAEDLPNQETDTTYCNWDKMIGDAISADTTITGTWEDIVCLDYSPNSISADFLMQIMIGSVPSELSSATEHEYYFVKNHTPSDPGKVYDCANTSSNQNYFTIAYEISGTTAKIYVSGNGHRIYAPVNSSKMFSNNTKVTSIDFSNLFTSNVTNMRSMFQNCSEITELNVSHFDTSKVTDMKDMFNGCAKITELDLSNFDTSNVNWTSMGGCGQSIFNGCSSLVTIYASDKFVSTLLTLTIFDGCTSLVGGAGTKYSDAETSDPTKYKTAAYARIDGGTSTPGYFTLKQ